MPAPTRRPRLTYANLASTLALVLALTSGTAYAAGLAPGSVKARHIATGAVITRHVADNAIVNRHLAADAVTRDEIANGTITGADVATNSLTGDDVANGSIQGDELSAGVRDQLGEGARSGSLVVNHEPPDFSVTSSSWPTVANAQFSRSWNQPAGTVDFAYITARVAWTASCRTSAGEDGFEVKIVDASGRVVSADSATSSENGNGFLSEQGDKRGPRFEAPGDGEGGGIDYVTLPLELASFVNEGSGTAGRELSFLFRRYGCAGGGPQITNVRMLVYRFG